MPTNNPPTCYVGNIPYSSSEEDLRKLFSQWKPKRVTLINDRETKRFRGIAFVELNSTKEVNDAIDSLNGSDYGGRTLHVAEARAREPRAAGPQPPQRNQPRPRSNNDGTRPERGNERRDDDDDGGRFWNGR